MQWNPDLYERYRALRERPGCDLLAAIPPIAARTMVDLGCGTGYLTRQLADQFPTAAVTGLDGDPAMLAKAGQEASRVTWQRGDIADWRPEMPPDLIFSNAALQWLPGHEALFARLVLSLARGGVLAVQMPDNYAAPSHRLLLELAGREPWAQSLTGALHHGSVLTPEDYWRVLRPHCTSVDIWHSDYLQELAGDDPVLEWVSATALLPVMARLPGNLAASFRAAYGAALRDAYPRQADGSTLFPFRRIFILARI
ncbi:methyltransferase domain-containing protein [Niveispirillum sp. KHB5.9]|uniref:methyltransferase domain-containing protein n=1 Tax=Niveispirillum sp. KHB5.9 TaxID=3400269 RepID=UPI003A8C1FBE